MTQTILVVDDSTVSRMMIKAIINEALPQCTIIEAKSGDDALNKISPNQVIDIALIDYNMPGMTGLELAVKIEQQVTIPKRALLTANIQESIQKETEKAGIIFLNKPISQEIITQFLLS